METSRMKIGRVAEDMACEFLMRRGHTILGRNWRSGHLELDVISLDSARRVARGAVHSLGPSWCRP